DRREEGGKEDCKEGRPMSEESDRLQEVWYDLDQYWLPNDLKTVICRVIMRLPDNVRDFATNNCTFIAFDNSLLGLCLPASQFTHLTRRGRTMRNHYTILLNASIATKNDGQFTVAHEIAHAWLRRAGGKTKRGRREPIMTNDFLAEERAD